jgi:hypothetical protein
MLVTGCRADCPNTRTYDPNQDGETLGCIYKYGSLPKSGFPPWCPLRDDERGAPVPQTDPSVQTTLP